MWPTGTFFWPLQAMLSECCRLWMTQRVSSCVGWPSCVAGHALQTRALLPFLVSSLRTAPVTLVLRQKASYSRSSAL
jgi:hypothetical protein